MNNLYEENNHTYKKKKKKRSDWKQRLFATTSIVHFALGQSDDDILHIL